MYTARLHGFTGSGVDSCYRQRIRWADKTLFGTVYIPSVCEDRANAQGALETWGEVWAQDESCVPKWSTFKDDGCISLGYRQFSAAIKGAPPDVQSQLDWCEEAQAVVKSVTFHSPNR